MYKIIFSANNNEEVMVLPYVPPDLPIPEPEQHNDVYSGLTRDYSKIGTLGLRSMSWSGLLPVGRRYGFMPAEASTDGWRYVDFFRRWRARCAPLRIVVLDSQDVSRLNMACTVDSFEPTVRRNGDLNYSITITEYRFVGGG